MAKKFSIYLIGSMRNPKVPQIANRLRHRGFDVFDDWHATGPASDELRQKYEQKRGRSYIDAMKGVHAVNVFNLDKHHLDTCDVAVMVLPAGRSAHLELGYKCGIGHKAYILMPGEPNRFDVMYGFANAIFFNEQALTKELIKERNRKS